ncbi:uncharacterized protein LOC143848841 [Tasmannia lanceolata]|uniref:uncharacterized protein LOC143848841 n=1 Tax=Tasmannia lanceolata TaxID=3420 RepID=UPI004062B1E8
MVEVGDAKHKREGSKAMWSVAPLSIIQYGVESLKQAETLPERLAFGVELPVDIRDDFISTYMRSQTPAEGTPTRMDASSPSSINIDRSRPEVILMSMKEPGLEVAKGLLVSDDPMTLVDGKPMGDGFSLVSIRVAMVGTEPLIRPSGRRKTIRDAAGGHVPWVSSFVKRTGST